MLGPSSLSGLPFLRDARRGRVSSYDETGGNNDRWLLAPGETRTLAQIAGPGAVRHIWMTLASREDAYPRRSVLRMYWDAADTPCVEVPAGDFFGVGHGIAKDFWSLPLTMSPREGRGFNCYFPMPFNSDARIEITNEGERRLVVYFYVDYETYERPLENTALFHAQWRRQNPTDGWGDDSRRITGDLDYLRELFATPNIAGDGNYLLLEATGRGHYVGCKPQHRLLRAPQERLVRRGRRHDLHLRHRPFTALVPKTTLIPHGAHSRSSAPRITASP